MVAFHYLGKRQSGGTSGAGVSAETGWRVKVTESMADRAAPAVGTSTLFALVLAMVSLMARIEQDFLSRKSSAMW